ncbi:PREDICTED: proline-rich protein 2-like [Ceratotherium simum simum]|uniref:Proline-rich protein 2-like n=1 Tax=Ceratotherium simum simum TaxID=73337 RepID=A0ABM1DEJ8_CERSS|nr:PREDICTED: proline-rich protein 2-like [Ceratotherium simum simum]
MAQGPVPPSGGDNRPPKGRAYGQSVFNEKNRKDPECRTSPASLTPAGPGRPQTTEATEGIATAPPTAPKSQLPGPRTRRPVLEPRGSEGAFFPTPTPTDTRGRASPAADRARESAGRAVPPARGRGLGGLPPSLGHRPRRGRSPSPYPLRGPARPPGPEAQPSRGKGGTGADRRKDTYLKGYIVSLPALPGRPVTRARTSGPMTSARRLSSTAHRLTPPSGGAAPQGPRSAQ